MELEDALCRTHSHQLIQEWRSIMRLSKLESLRNDVSILSQDHENALARKHAMVLLLRREFDNVSESLAKCAQIHANVLDVVLDMHEKNTSSLRKVKRFHLVLHVFD